MGGIKEKEKGIKGDKLNLTRCHEREKEGGAYFGDTACSHFEGPVSLYFSLVGEWQQIERGGGQSSLQVFLGAFHL